MHNVLILTYWAYDDALIQTYTLPYLKLIKEQLSTECRIWLVTYEPDQIRLAELKVAKFDSFNLVPLPYSPFGGKAIFSTLRKLQTLKKIVKQHRIKTIHCWCTPAGAIGYMLAKRTGAELILDSFEPHAESMVENGTWKAGGTAFKILFKLEKRQAAKAKHIIALTKGMYQYCEEKYEVSPRSYFVKPACVDLDLFDPEKYQNIRQQLGLSKEDTVCIYAGKVGGIYLEKEIFQFWKACAEVMENFKVIFLSNLSQESLNAYCTEVGLDPDIIVLKFVPHAKVPIYMAQADFALNPVKPVPSKRYCTSIKDGEYWAMGLPVAITPNISDDSDIISKNRTGVILEDFRHNSLLGNAKLLKNLISEPELTVRIRNQAMEYRSFSIARDIYAEIYAEP